MKRASRHVVSSARGAALALTMLGCGSRGPTVDLNLTVRAPLTAGDVDYAEISATQGGDSTRVIVTGQSSGVLRLYAGTPARITATVFDFVDGDVPEWRSYEATYRLTPEPGTADVAMEVQITPSATAMFAGRFAGGAAIIEPLAIEVFDHATEFTRASAFFTGQRFVYPANRAAQFRVIRSDDGQSYAWDTVVDGPPAVGSTIPMGLDPLLAFASSEAYTALGEIVPATALGIVATPPYEVECAAAPSCDNAGVWRSCDQALPLAQERRYEVCARYVEIPGVVANAYAYRDLTPPVLRATLSPSFAGVPPPASATLTVDSNEALSSDSVVVTPAQAGLTCASPVWVSSTRYQCTLSLGAWLQGTYPTLSVRVRAADLAGNAGESAGTVRATQTGALNIVGATPFPAVPSPSSYRVLVAVDVLNTTGLTLTGVNINPQTARLVSPDAVTIAYGDMSGGGSSTLDALPSSATATGRIWLWLNSTYQQPTDGSYTLYVTAGGFGGAGPITSLEASFPLYLRVPAVRWVGPGPLVISTLTGAAPAGTPFAVDALPFVGGVDSYNLGLGSSDPTVLRILGAGTDGGATGLVGMQMGSATLTFTDLNPTYPSQAAIDVDVVAAPTLLALKADRLVRRTSSGDSTLLLDDRIGTAQRVLWESARDAVLVVGSTGVEVFFADDTSVVHLAPCGASTIRSASLTDARTERARPYADLALLIEDATSAVRYCEIDPVSGEVAVAAQAIPMGACSSAPTALVADPVTGLRMALAAGCSTRFSVSAGTLTARGAKTSSALTSAPRAATLDAYGAAVGVLTASDPPLAGVWGLGPDMPVGGPLGVIGRDPTQASAIAVDPLTGSVIVAGFSQANPTAPRAPLLFFVANRFGTSVSQTSERPIELGSLSFEHLAVDATNRILYAADNGVARALWSFDMDAVRRGTAFDVTSGGVTTRPWADGLPVVDLAVAGPQPLAVDPMLAEPGTLATIVGVGFAGDGRDQVYVHGLASEVISSTTTSVTFRVPPSLDDLSVARNIVWVTVRSHGRLSGPVTVAHATSISPALTIAPSRPFRSLSAPQYAGCIGDCVAPPALVPTLEAEVLALYPGGLGADFAATSQYTPTLYSAIPSPDGGIYHPLGSRVIGISRAGTTWVATNRLSLDAVAGNEQRTVSLSPQLPAGTPHVAASPDGQWLALARGNSFAVYALSTLEAQTPAYTTGMNPIHVVVFTADGRELVLAGANGEVEIRRLDNLATTLTYSSAGTCSYAGMIPFDARRRANANDEVELLYTAAGGDTLHTVAVRTADTGGKERRCLSSGTLPSPSTILDAVFSPTAAWVYVAQEEYVYQQWLRVHANSDLGTLQALVSLGSYVTGVDMAVSRDDYSIVTSTDSGFNFATVQDVP